jgi:hypothetical protein
VEGILAWWGVGAMLGLPLFLLVVPLAAMLGFLAGIAEAIVACAERRRLARANGDVEACAATPLKPPPPVLR